MSKEIKLQLQGVKCSGCVASVEAALKALPVESVSVDLATKTAVVKAADTVSFDDLVAAIRKAGYDASAISG